MEREKRNCQKIRTVPSSTVPQENRKILNCLKKARKRKGNRKGAQSPPASSDPAPRILPLFSFDYFFYSCFVFFPYAPTQSINLRKLYNNLRKMRRRAIFRPIRKNVLSYRFYERTPCKKVFSNCSFTK